MLIIFVIIQSLIMQVQGQKKDVRLYNVSQQYQVLQKIGKGTYGTVFKARSKTDKRNYAIKKLQNNDPKLQMQGFPITALRQVMLLKQMNHPNIIGLRQIVLSKPSKRNLYRGSTFLVLEYMDHDLAGLFKNNIKFSLPQIKCIMKQLLQGVQYLHTQKILHRDIKPANILLNDRGEIKLADFGLGRRYLDIKNMTFKVVTLWYRAPQLILKYLKYDFKIDVWSIGCVFAEFFTRQVLFKKDNQYSQLDRIIQLCGDYNKNFVPAEVIKQFKDTLTQKSSQRKLQSYIRNICPSITDDALDLLAGLLDLNPLKRLSCTEALKHPFFTNSPLPCKPSQMSQLQYEFHDMVKQFIKIDKLPYNQKDRARNKNSQSQSNYSSRKSSSSGSKSISQNKKKGKQSSSSNDSKDYQRSRRKSKHHYNKQDRYKSIQHYKHNDRHGDRHKNKQRDHKYKDKEWDRNKDRDKQYKQKDRNRDKQKEKDKGQQKQKDKYKQRQKQGDKYRETKNYKQYDREKDRYKDKEKQREKVRDKQRQNQRGRHNDQRQRERNNHRDREKIKQNEKQRQKKYEKQRQSQRQNYRYGSREKDRQRHKEKDYKNRRQIEDRYYKKQGQHYNKYNKEKFPVKQDRSSKGYHNRDDNRQKIKLQLNEPDKKEKLKDQPQESMRERIEGESKNFQGKNFKHNYDRQKPIYEKPRHERYQKQKDRQRGEKRYYHKYDRRSESEQRRKHYKNDGRNKYQRQKQRQKNKKSNSNSSKSRSRSRQKRPKVQYDY